MAARPFTCTASVWIYPSERAQWHFVTIPKDVSARVNAHYGKLKRGWGSLPVSVRIGKTHWNTSIFPDTKSGTFILPLKTAVRSAEGIFDGDTVTLKLVVCP